MFLSLYYKYGNIFPLLFRVMIQNIILPGASQPTDITETQIENKSKVKFV